jgi:hypothetical protein
VAVLGREQRSIVHIVGDHENGLLGGAAHRHHLLPQSAARQRAQRRQIGFAGLHSSPHAVCRRAIEARELAGKLG